MNKDGYTDGDTVRSNVVRIYKGIDTIDSFASISASLSNSRAELARKLNKPEGGSYVLDTEVSDRIKDKVTNDKNLQELIKGEKGDKGDQGAKGDKGDKGEQGASGTNVGRNLLLNSGDPRFQDGRCAVYKLAYPLDKEGDYFLSFDVAFDKNQLYTPYGYRMKVIFGYQTALETTGYIDYYESLHKGFSRLRLNVTKNSTYQGGAKTIYIYPNEDYENPDTDPRCGKFTIKNVMLEYGNKPTVWSPAPEDMLAELDNYTTLTQYNNDREEDSRKLDSKLDKPASGKYILDIDIPSEFEKLVKVGGRNLIKDSKNTLSNSNYFVGRYYIADPSQMVAGEEYTIQIWGTVDGFSERLWVYNSGGNTEVASIPKITNGVWKHTFKWRDEANKSNSSLSLYRAANESNNNKSLTTITKIKLERGNVATDWTPAPEDTQSEIKDLQQLSPTKDQKDWLNKMGQVLLADGKESGKTYYFNGVSIGSSIFTRFSNGKPSEIIGGKDAVLMAGVQDYGTTNQSERTAIYQDGSAKFGDVKLNNKTITLMPKSGLPLRVTAEEGSFIENFLANSKDDRYIAYEKSFVVWGKGEAQTYSFNVDNNDTKLTITIPNLTSEVYQINQSVILTLDGVTLGSWHGDTKLIKEDTSGIVGGGVRFRKENTPLVVENLQFERYLSSGSHTLSVSVTSTVTTDKATITKLTAHLYYDASQAETILTHKGFRAFGGQNRYFDIDWSWTYRAKGYFTTSNPYIARVKGGMRVDSLTLEQPLDAPGCVLAGGSVTWGGTINNSFGKYKNEIGKGNPTAYYNSSRKVFVVNHSIGNTRYVPMITSTAGSWSDLPQVVAVNSYSFEVAFINGNNDRNQWSFNYTCFKAD